MKRSDFVYLAITNDEYELPIGIFLDIKELCKWSGKTKDTLASNICRQNVDLRYNCRYKRVFVGEEV